MTRLGVRLAAAIAIAALLTTGACGLSEDGDPQAIAPGNLPPDLLDPNPTSSTTLPAEETVPITVYLLRGSGEDTELVPVKREVRDPNMIGQRIEAVLNAQRTDAERGRGYSSAIPPEVRLLDTRFDPDSGELLLDLSGELFAIQSSELSKAFAQIVYTAAEVDGVRSVRFRIEGEPRQAVDGEGGQQTSVDIGDYRALAPG